jgi:hypothetical protein
LASGVERWLAEKEEEGRRKTSEGDHEQKRPEAGWHSGEVSRKTKKRRCRTQSMA